MNSLFDLLLFEQFQTLLLYVNSQATSKEHDVRVDRQVIFILGDQARYQSRILAGN